MIDRKNSAVRRAAGVAAGVVALIGLASPGAIAATGAEARQAPDSQATVFPRDLAHPNAHWVAVRTVPLPEAGAAGAVKQAPSLGAAVSPRDGDLWTQARNAQPLGQVCHTDNIDEVTGGGPIVLTLTNSRAIASQYSASVSIIPKFVSATVGFSVTDTVTSTESGAYSVPAGKNGGIIAHPLFDQVSFEEYNVQLGITTGYGTALKPVGFCYETWAN